MAAGLDSGGHSSNSELTLQQSASHGTDQNDAVVSGSLVTEVRVHETASVPITTRHSGTDAVNCQSSDTLAVTVYSSGQNSSQTPADKVVNTADIESPTAPDCVSKDGSDLPIANADKTGVAESYRSSLNMSEYHTGFHRDEGGILGSSADVELTEIERRKFDGDGVLNGDDDIDQNLSGYQNSRFHTVGESVVVSSMELENDVAEVHRSEAIVNRQRRVSAARSALYRRLLSSETAGSSDVDMSCDIFDLQSLSSSDDDDDSDNGDLNLDSSSDRSFLVIVFFYKKKSDCY